MIKNDKTFYQNVIEDTVLIQSWVSLDIESTETSFLLHFEAFFNPQMSNFLVPWFSCDHHLHQRKRRVAAKQRTDKY
jgi:hypothetical protein